MHPDKTACTRTCHIDHTEDVDILRFGAQQLSQRAGEDLSLGLCEAGRRLQLVAYDEVLGRDTCVTNVRQ